MVSGALRHVAYNWQVNHAESDVVGSQGMSRFMSIVALRRFGMIEPDPNGLLDLGKTSRRYSISPRGGGNAVVDNYLRMDFGILPHMTLLQITANIRAKLQELPASQLMGGDYLRPYLVRAYVGARGIDAHTHTENSSPGVSSMFPGENLLVGKTGA